MDPFAEALVHLDLGDSAEARARATGHYRAACARLGCSTDGTETELRQRLAAQLERPDTRLAAYGTLRPGQPNHREVADLGGTWRPGHTPGQVVRLASGYPALRPADDPAAMVTVEVLESPALPAGWAALDAFEGPDYRRTPVAVILADGRRVAAYAYLDRSAPRPEPALPHP